MSCTFKLKSQYFFSSVKCSLKLRYVQLKPQNRAVHVAALNRQLTTYTRFFTHSLTHSLTVILNIHLHSFIRHDDSRTHPHRRCHPQHGHWLPGHHALERPQEGNAVLCACDDASSHFITGITLEENSTPARLSIKAVFNDIFHPFLSHFKLIISISVYMKLNSAS